MSISVFYLFIWMMGCLAFVFWHFLTSPITPIHRAVMENDIDKVKVEV